jgi:hypothetical protein
MVKFMWQHVKFLIRIVDEVVGICVIDKIEVRLDGARRRV